MDLGSESDPYVRVRSQGKVYGRTPVKGDNSDPVWNYVMDITGVRLDQNLDFDIWDRDFSKMNDRIGFARISVRDLIKRPQTLMLLVKSGGSGDFVVKKPEHLPTELHVAIVKSPVGWPVPTPSEFEKGVPKNKYPKHVMIITRGTRGDVQPFCALARGLANMQGYCVTICTELRYKDFVEKNGEKLERGAIRYRPSGGDTHSRIDKPIARWAMAHQSELMQMAMLARTEREFFPSEPIFYFWTGLLQPDVIIYGFTLVNIAMIISEKFHIPAVGFMLQPTVIPSEQYPPVAAIDTHLISYLDTLEKRFASSHDFLSTFKKWMEDDPIWSPLSTMRENRGLRPFKGRRSETFAQLLKQNAPIVVPINAIAFGGRPKDWPSSIVLTDFIFLQGGAVPKLPQKIIDFIDKAHEAGDPVVAMTFSSMPVSRGDIIQSSLKIVKDCESHPRVIALSGSKVNDKISPVLTKELQVAVEEGKILEMEGAPFDLLFRRLDALCVHGGLGTTAEAMRAGLPTTVVGVLLMDQRFWGMQCEKLGIGAPMVHIALWKKKCVSVVDAMLKAGSTFKSEARALAQRIQPTSADGVPENVQAIVQAIDSAVPIDTTEIRTSTRRRSSGPDSTSRGSRRLSQNSTESSVLDRENSIVSPLADDEIIESQSNGRKEVLNHFKKIASEHQVNIHHIDFNLRDSLRADLDLPADDRDEFVQ